MSSSVQPPRKRKQGGDAQASAPRRRAEDVLLDDDDCSGEESLLLSEIPPTARRALEGGEVAPYLREIINSGVREVASTGAAPGPALIPTMQDRVVFIVQRKRDAMNCYLRTCCMRLSEDIVLGGVVMGGQK